MADTAKSIVEEQLLKPLAVRDDTRSRFSRARPAPVVRRLRLVNPELLQDSQGEAFMTFAVDAQHGWGPKDNEAKWQKDALVGCVYPDSGAVYIRRGDSFRPAAFLLGKKLPVAAEHICREQPGEVAKAG